MLRVPPAGGFRRGSGERVSQRALARARAFSTLCRAFSRPTECWARDRASPQATPCLVAAGVVSFFLERTVCSLVLLLGKWTGRWGALCSRAGRGSVLRRVGWVGSSFSLERKKERWVWGGLFKKSICWARDLAKLSPSRNGARLLRSRKKSETSDAKETGEQRPGRGQGKEHGHGPPIKQDLKPQGRAPRDAHARAAATTETRLPTARATDGDVRRGQRNNPRTTNDGRTQPRDEPSTDSRRQRHGSTPEAKRTRPRAGARPPQGHGRAHG